MHTKTFRVEGVGEVQIAKRRGNKNIRLSFASSGQVRISLPYFAPYQTGVRFASSKKAWIVANRPQQKQFLDGQVIGKSHHLSFESNASALRPRYHLINNVVNVFVPAGMVSSHTDAQAAASRGVLRALRVEAEAYLPNELARLARIHGYKYRNLTIKPMKTRWGSCDSRRQIKLNLYLMNLTPELIEYVLLHELVHTKFPHHQVAFWAEMKRVLPNVSKLKVNARAARPGIPS